MMWMPAIVISHHSHGHIANLSFACELGLLQVGHPNYVHAPTAVYVGLRFGGELRPFHAQIGSAALAAHSRFLARGFHDLSEFMANRIGKGNVGYHAFAKKSIHTMASAVEE